MSKVLKHIGILGMRWGHRKKPDMVNNNVKNLLKVKTLNDDILKRNPDAAVVRYDPLLKKNTNLVSVKSDTPKKDLTEEERIRKRNLIIAGVAGATIIAAGALYLANKEQVDSFVYTKLGMPLSGLKPVHVGDPLSEKDINLYKKLGINGIETTQDAIKADFVAAWIGHDQVRYNSIPIGRYMNEKEDFVVKAGETFKRVTKQANEVLRDGAYISLDGDDAKRYEAFLPKMWERNAGPFGNVGQAYSMTLKSLEELKSPSLKKRIDTYAELLMTDRAFGMSQLYSGKTKSDAIAHALKNYNTFATDDMVSRGTSFNKYKDKLIELGYNAVIDDNDAGRLSRNPLVLLKSSILQTISQLPLTNDLIQQAANSIQPMDGESRLNTVSVLIGKDANGTPMSAYVNAYALP